MTLVLDQKPELLINLDKNILIEKFTFKNKFKKPIFLLGTELINLKKIILEVRKKDESSEIEEIILTFPKVIKEKVLKIAKFFDTNSDEISNIEDLEGANLIFSIKQDILKNKIQPMYDESSGSKDLFKFIDEFEIPFLLNFSNYQVEGLFN